MSMSGEACRVVSWADPELTDFERVFLTASEKGWVFAGGHDEATDRMTGLFLPILHKAKQHPSITEVANLLSNPLENDELIAIEKNDDQTTVTIEAQLHPTVQVLAHELIDLTRASEE